jgi:hypothetical protein
VQVPAPAANAPGWSLADYGRASRSADRDADGTITVEFDQVPDGELWLVDRIVVFCDSATLTRALVYDDAGAEPRSVRDGTQTGNFDVADNASPIQLEAGTQLVIVWSQSPDPGSTGTAFAQWSVLRRDA